MSNATGKQRLSALFVKLILILLFAINIGAFAGMFLITLFPTYNVGALGDNLGNNFNTFAMWNSDGDKITNWGIVMLSLVSFAIVATIIVIPAIKRASFTIGKNNKILKYFVPMVISALLLMIVSLINKPGLIQFEEGYDSFLFKLPLESSFSDFNFNNVTIAWYVVTAIFGIAAIGYVFDIVWFTFRVLFSRTHSKTNQGNKQYQQKQRR